MLFLSGFSPTVWQKAYVWDKAIFEVRHTANSRKRVQEIKLVESQVLRSRVASSVVPRNLSLAWDLGAGGRLKNLVVVPKGKGKVTCPVPSGWSTPTLCLRQWDPRGCHLARGRIMEVPLVSFYHWGATGEATPSSAYNGVSYQV